MDDVLLLALWQSAASAVVCYYLARSKKRPAQRWAILGVFFGVFAIIVLACLSEGTPEQKPIPKDIPYYRRVNLDAPASDGPPTKRDDGKGWSV